MSLPIILTTYNRAEYFLNTIKSLENSNCDVSNLTIFDDASTEKSKIKALNSVSDKYRVILRGENLGTFKNGTLAIDETYKDHESDIVFLQDDVIFSKNWLENGFELYYMASVSYRIAFFSFFNLRKQDEKKYYIMHMGHPSAVGWIVNGKWWGEYRRCYKIGGYGTDRVKECDKLDTKNPHVKHLIDYKLANRAYDMDWKVAKAGKSLIQHVGDRSTISIKDMSFCRTKNFVGENK